MRFDSDSSACMTGIECSGECRIWALPGLRSFAEDPTLMSHPSAIYPTHPRRVFTQQFAGHAGVNEGVTEFRPFTKHAHIEEQEADDLAWKYCARDGTVRQQVLGWNEP